MTDSDTEWYWCLKHNRAEQGQACPAENRMGPYPTEEAARNWQQRSDERNRDWDADDAAWERGG